MLTKEDMVLIRDLMKEVIDEKLEPIKKDIADMKDDIADMKDDIDIIKEDVEITRSCTNDIIEWIDFNFHDEYPFPVKKIKTL